MAHLGADVAGEHDTRVVEVLEAQRVLLPDIQHVLQHRAVQLILGAEVIVQIGTRQLGLFGDIAHGRRAVAFLGEDLFGRLENLLDIAPTDFDLVVGHWLSVYSHAPHRG
ncbi:hypothetical protein D9M71_690000 [compost metagenome]